MDKAISTRNERYYYYYYTKLCLFWTKKKIKSINRHWIKSVNIFFWNLFIRIAGYIIETIFSCFYLFSFSWSQKQKRSIKNQFNRYSSVKFLLKKKSNDQFHSFFVLFCFDRFDWKWFDLISFLKIFYYYFGCFKY